MAEAPTQEELEQAREYLANLQAENNQLSVEKEDEAAADRRRAEGERLLQEIAFAEQSNAILRGVPPEPAEAETNTPPDNAAQVSEPPQAPSFPGLGEPSEEHDNDDEDGE